MFQKYATCYITVSNLRRYRQQWHNIYYYFIPFSLSSSQISLSLHLLISIFSLISVFSIHLPQHADHQWPPLDASDHLSSLFHFEFSYFSFFLFSVHVFWLWFDGLVRMGKLAVGGFSGYGGGWVEFHRLWDMAMGGLRWADRWWVGSCCGLWRWVGWDGDGQISGGGWVGWWWANQWWANRWWRIDGGADLCSDLFLSLFFCFGGCDLMVDLVAIVGWFWW